MEKLDVKDRKILYELDIDSRQSFSQLGKKVGLHKDVVAYRVKKLQEKGIIKNFYTHVNEFRIGYSPIKFYFTYQNITPEIKQEIIDYLVKNPYTATVHSAEGQYDLCVISSVENVAKFYDIWSNIINKYRDFFSNQIFCVHNKLIEYKKTFLLDEKTDKKDDRILFVVSSSDKKIEIDSLDKKILDLLLLNSRIITLEIAQKLNSTVNTINSRIKKLVKTGVILRYTINLDWPKIGYQWYKADIVLKNPEKKQQIVEYIENNPNLFHRIASLGYVDLELIFILNNANQLHQIMEDLSSKFPDTIRTYKYFSATKTHKYIGVDFWNR
jgi:Lrp/AsnC family transcriptional regulator for asnA, asnC and gidA